jgi:hypothetical protein
MAARAPRAVPRPPWRSGRRSAGWCSGAPAGGARPVAAGAPSRSTTSSNAPRGARTIGEDTVSHLSSTSVAPAPCLARGIAVIPVSTLIHNTKSGRSGAAWQPGSEIRDGLTTDGEETVTPSAIDAGFAVATCVSPLVGRRNVTLTRWSRTPTVAPRGIVCVSPKLPRAFLAQHSKRSAEHVGRRETMSVRSRRETVQAEPEGTLAVIHALGLSLGITLWTRCGGRRPVEPPRA